MPKYVACLSALFFAPGIAFAGMPSLRLTDVGRMRVESLSFFFVAFLLCAWVFQGMWNLLRRDFASLPRLSYGKALGMVTVWGALFVVVLTMISGARELLTPGAWEKVGFTYKLKGQTQADVLEPPSDTVRRASLEKLRLALWGFSASHDGQLPSSSTDPAIAEEFWRTPDPSGVIYGYVPGRKVHAGTELIAFEPRIYADNHYVLLANGEVKQFTDAELDAAISELSAP